MNVQKYTDKIFYTYYLDSPFIYLVIFFTMAFILDAFAVTASFDTVDYVSTVTSLAYLTNDFVMLYSTTNISNEFFIEVTKCKENLR